MWSLYLKELRSFFSTLTGYFVIAIFLLATGVLMWVLPETSILTHEYATLEQLFSLGPVLFLFLIPALCMRSFSEELSARTYELLVTHPLSITSVIRGKYLAGFTLALFSILPTLVYWYSVVQLGSPPGNIDSGATIGAYLGLILLASAFVSISISASSLSSNQVVSFLLGLGGCAMMCWGFDLFGSDAVTLGPLKFYWNRMGLLYHYVEMSQGWVHLSDAVYFVAVTIVFNGLTRLILEIKKGRRAVAGSIRQFVYRLLVVVLAYAAFVYADLSFDMTEDKLYTLNDASANVVSEIDDPVVVHILLEGDLPESMERLQSRAISLIRRFNRINSNIGYELIDPSEGTVDEINAMRKELTEAGMYPVNVRSVSTDQSTENLLFPYAVIQRGERQMPVDLLGEASLNIDSRQQINNSMALMEYRLVYALNKILSDKPGTIAFTTGHGELEVKNTADLRQQLTPFYRTGQLILDSVDQIPGEVDLVVIAGPTGAFSDSEKFLLDQYIMEGGRVMFFIDKLVVSLDSLRTSASYVPYNTASNLDDLLFKYGIRVETSLVRDLECAKIPLVVNTTAQGPQYELFDWYYFPLAIPSDEHPLSRSLDRVLTTFPSGMDTVKTLLPVKKTPILTSSASSNLQAMPANISFEILRYPPDPDQFNGSKIPLGYLLEGQLPSAFTNRPAGRAREAFAASGKEVLNSAMDGKILVFTDSDIIQNGLDPKTGEIYPMGYQRFENRRYGNREFVVNAVEYLLDDRNIIDARNKRIRPRFLNVAKATSEKLYWQLLNVLLPILVLALCGIIFQLVRRRTYA